jgi:hypothetical protein
MLSRAEVNNYFISNLKLHRYLEIGVEAGVTFNEVVANKKVAVDPDFKIAPSELKGAAFKLTSDRFFDEHPGEIFDMIFIDGLHTYEQSLRDFTRSLSRLSDHGVIIIDDCFPSDYLASLRDHGLCVRAKTRENCADRNWMGDVYKTVLFINEFFDNLDFAYVQDTMGVVAVWRARRKLTPLLGGGAMTELVELEYAKFRHEIFPSLPQKSVSEILDCITGTRAPAPAAR